MKKLVALVGIGVLSFAFMSSTCTSHAGEAKKGKTSAIAPTAGITFKKKSFEEAKKEAKKSGKLIFIDAYTDWCGPCKRMAATSFKDPKVGEMFNKNFI